MQHDVRHGHIAFLLSLGTAALGCDFDDAGSRCALPHDQADDGKDDDEDEAEASSGGTTDGGETAGETGGDGTGDAPATDGGADEAPGGTTGDPGGGETTGGGDTSMCQPYVDHYVECFPSGDPQALLDGCVYSIQAGHAASPACGTAVEDWYACLVQTPGDVVLAGEPYCETERAAVDGECPAQETSG